MPVEGDVVKTEVLYFLSIFIEILVRFIGVEHWVSEGSIWYGASTVGRSSDPRRSCMGVVVSKHCSGKANL